MGGFQPELEHRKISPPESIWAAQARRPGMSEPQETDEGSIMDQAIRIFCRREIEQSIEETERGIERRLASVSPPNNGEFFNQYCRQRRLTMTTSEKRRAYEMWSFQEAVKKVIKPPANLPAGQWENPLRRW